MHTTLAHVISPRTGQPPPQQPAPKPPHHAHGCPSAADTPHTPPPGRPAFADSDAPEPAAAAAACHSPCVPRVNPPSVVCAPSTPAIVVSSVRVRLRILSCVCAGPRPELVSGGGRASSYAGTQTSIRRLAVAPVAKGGARPSRSTSHPARRRSHVGRGCGRRRA